MLAVLTAATPLVLLFVFAVMITAGVILIVEVGSTGAVVLASFLFVCVILLIIVVVVFLTEIGTLILWAYKNRSSESNV